MAADLARATDILHSTFGYTDFLPLQKEIITHILDRRDTLVVMPTGGGKSLCYQIPALIFPGLTVVVSPLISLMKDQVEQLTENGVAACFINSSLSAGEYEDRVNRVRRRELKLVYVAPETLLTQRFIDLLTQLEVSCIAVDEAHCISEWGHDFRPEYRQIATLRQRFPKAVCIALTATATPHVQQDIQASLKMGSQGTFIASFNRDNLFLEVVDKEDAPRQAVEFIRRFPKQSGIVYCFSRKEVEKLAAHLKREGFSALPYHAGLEDAVRKRNQERFIRDDVQIIVATIAFGMGINKPNVRFILHYDLPKSLESYYQEIGRAGRDHLPAACRLLFGYGDIQKIRYFINQKEGKEQQVAKTHLEAMVRYAETKTCRRSPLIHYFGEAYQRENCAMCDNCRPAHRTLADLTIPALKFLSCVKRTGEIFGAAYITDVLLGVRSQKVIEHAHQELSTFNIGRELDAAQWRGIADLLIEKGFLSADDHYGSLKLTPAAYELFKTRQPVLGNLEDRREKIEPKGKTAAKTADDLHGEALELFELLREKRKEIADAVGYPPYVIFSDRTLIEMAARPPRTLGEMSAIFGIGSKKLASYGQPFLAVIERFQIGRDRTRRKPLTENGAAPRYIEVARDVSRGMSLPQVMEKYSIQEATVVAHLTRYLQEGNRVESRGFLTLPELPQKHHDRVLECFANLGADALKPVFEALNGSVNYNDLRLFRLEYLLLIQPETRQAQGGL